MEPSHDKFVALYLNMSILLFNLWLLLPRYNTYTSSLAEVILIMYFFTIIRVRSCLLVLKVELFTAGKYKMINLIVLSN